MLLDPQRHWQRLPRAAVGASLAPMPSGIASATLTSPASFAARLSRQQALTGTSGLCCCLGDGLGTPLAPGKQPGPSYTHFSRLRHIHQGVCGSHKPWQDRLQLCASAEPRVQCEALPLDR